MITLIDIVTAGLVLLALAVVFFGLWKVGGQICKENEKYRKRDREMFETRMRQIFHEEMEIAKKKNEL